MILPHTFTTKSICLAVSITLAVIGYVPLFKRLHRRHHTRDFSKPFQWCYLMIQMNNGVMAYSEHAPFLLSWYIIQTVFSSGLLFLIYRYWDRPNPQ